VKRVQLALFTQGEDLPLTTLVPDECLEGDEESQAEGFDVRSDQTDFFGDAE
jgi:hypothetical protein